MIQSTIAGYIGRDAMQKELGGTTLVEFSVAVRQVKKVEHTIWVKCNIWGQRGISLLPFLRKGSFIVAAGQMDLRSYQTKEGKPASELSLNVSEVTLGPRTEPAYEEPARKEAYDEVPF